MGRKEVKDLEAQQGFAPSVKWRKEERKRRFVTKVYDTTMYKHLTASIAIANTIYNIINRNTISTISTRR